ncbi:hypothetical protein P4S63_04395 [Pseudoalteromonas sp. B193]
MDIQERIESEQILLEAKHQAETLAESKADSWQILVMKFAHH